ncbi:hypothetical protein N431DRAFT_149940 [Stipitochalara longipes BDJ]|nr:hypothetical protein N431DRAFT_149940 [Stipitochalara longipes BDJ]
MLVKNQHARTASISNNRHSTQLQLFIPVPPSLSSRPKPISPPHIKYPILLYISAPPPTFVSTIPISSAALVISRKTYFPSSLASSFLVPDSDFTTPALASIGIRASQPREKSETFIVCPGLAYCSFLAGFWK